MQYPPPASPRSSEPAAKCSEEQEGVSHGDDSTGVASATPPQQASLRHRPRGARVSRRRGGVTRGATRARAATSQRSGRVEPDHLLTVPEAAAMLDLPSAEQVGSAPLDALPAFVGTIEALKAKALARLLGDSPTPAVPVEASDRYVAVPEIAARFVLTQQYVYDAIRSGDLPAIEIGPKKYKRVALADLRAWAASKKVDPPVYFTYSPPSGSRRSRTTAEATRPHPTRTGRPSRRDPEQRGEVGTRRTRDQRVSGTPDATACEATEASTWQEEYLNDGVH